MKRMILSVIVMAFAVTVQAGDGGCCQDKEKAGCCANKVKTSLNGQASQAGDKEEGGCCASKMKTSVEAKGAARSLRAPAPCRRRPSGQPPSKSC